MPTTGSIRRSCSAWRWRGSSAMGACERGDDRWCRLGPRRALPSRPRVRGGLATALRDDDHRGDGVRRRRHPGERRGPRLARPDDREPDRPLDRRGDPDGRALLRRVADRPRRPAPRVRRATSPARDRAAADDRGRHARGRRPARRARADRGDPARDRARPDRRRAGAGGRHRSRAFRHASGRDSMSRAGSTTASACRCS